MLDKFYSSMNYSPGNEFRVNKSTVYIKVSLSRNILKLSIDQLMKMCPEACRNLTLYFL